MSPITILLVEDNFGDQKLFSLALENPKNTHLEVVGDGREALHFLHREGKYADAPSPDLVVLDINLPRKSGPEVLEEIRRNSTLKHLPVAMLTSAPATEVTLEACKHANLYIVKPDDGDKYFAVVRALEGFCRNAVGFPNLTRKYAEELPGLLKAAQCPEVYTPDTLERGRGL